MPTPIEILLDPISLIILAGYAGLMLWEGIAPGMQLPKVRGWRTKGLLFFVGFFYLSTYLPLLWDPYLAEYQVFDLTGFGVAAQTTIGLLVYELGAWAWHRAMHRFEPLWRMHQTHHSAERLDTYSAFLFHPLDMVGWTALGSLALVLVVGVSAQAATYIVLIATWLAMFQHSNVKTPHWLGYLVQRPESHTVHHARGIHHKNYSDLPIFDILFGSFENPRGYEHETGLYPGASKRNLDLLLMRDVSAPVVTRATAGAGVIAHDSGESGPDSSVPSVA
jgi:sterol desaturase/sphingolipid hydroxylase (fatty acid hydroxylase superfamily)